MPHLVLETTADLPENAHVPDILEALTLELARYDTVSSATIKAYHTLRSVWHMGEGAPPGFAHLTVALHTGRPLELRRKIAEGMFKVLREHLTESLEAEEVSVTVEIREMERETYMR
jgi:5-carboxymethyl-2-hydroxymuconate isomerase